MGPLLLIFGLALTLSFTIVMIATRPAGPSKSVQQRLIAIRQPVRVRKADEAGADLDRIEQRDYLVRLGAFLDQYPFSRKLQALLVHANSGLSVSSVVLIGAGLGIASSFAAYFFLHLIVVEAIALIAGPMIPYGILCVKRARRLKAFNTILPDAIDLMARALRAGHSMPSAIELIADQSAEPLSSEFTQVYQQQKFGLRFRDALSQMADRIPSRDLQFLITAILVQKETGGDLTETLDRTSHVIRERIRIEGEVRTHTAQGRLTGWILGLLPVIMLVLINFVSPGYSTVLFHDPVGQKLLYAGATLIVIGGLIIRKVVDIEV